MDIILIGISGFVGALLRYFIYLIAPSIHSQNFPYGTLIINLSGCLIAGALFGLMARLAPEQRHYITLILIGLVGSFTTFSTFSSETIHLLDSKDFLSATINVLGNVLGGMSMVWLGRYLMQLRF
jgi:fluoride exporter